MKCSHEQNDRYEKFWLGKTIFNIFYVFSSGGINKARNSARKQFHNIFSNFDENQFLSNFLKELVTDVKPFLEISVLFQK
jgi:hypothetical protein